MLLIIASLVVLLIELFSSLIIGRNIRVRVIGTFITDSLLHLYVFLGSGAPSEHPPTEYRAEERHLAASLALVVSAPARLLQPIRHSSFHVVDVCHLGCRLVRDWDTRVGRRMR